MSKNYLIADTHFGHNKISQKWRKEFPSDEEHNETIFENIMSCSGKRNHLYLLGDICMDAGQFWRLSEFKNAFETVSVVLGNHDPRSMAGYCNDHGINVYGFVKKWGYWLSHCPIHPQELYRGKNIHGHVHTNTIMSMGNIPDKDYFNVSCENVGYKPISLQEVKERLGDE